MIIAITMQRVALINHRLNHSIQKINDSFLMFCLSMIAKGKVLILVLSGIFSLFFLRDGNKDD